MDLFYDLQAFLDCQAEVGHDIRLCTKAELTPANPTFGIPAQYGYTCFKVQGHIQITQDRQIATDGTTTGKTTNMIGTAWLQPQEGFNPDAIAGDTLLWFQNHVYQLELMQKITHRGADMYFKYSLKRTTTTEIIKLDSD